MKNRAKSILYLISIKKSFSIAHHYENIFFLMFSDAGAVTATVVLLKSHWAVVRVHFSHMYTFIDEKDRLGMNGGGFNCENVCQIQKS